MAYTYSERSQKAEQLSDGKSDQELDQLIMAFRELRCSSVSHMAVLDSNRRLNEIQKALNNQFLTLAIGILGLALSVIQTVVVMWSPDPTVRWVSLGVIVIVGALLFRYLISTYKTGRKTKLYEIEQRISAAADARNEYDALRITAEENIIPMIESSFNEHKITDERYFKLKDRIEKTVSFFEREIIKRDQELKGLKADKEKLEIDR